MAPPVDKLSFSIDQNRQRLSRLRLIINGVDIEAHLNLLAGWWDPKSLTINLEALEQALSKPGEYPILTSSCEGCPVPEEMGLRNTVVQYEGEFLIWKVGKQESDLPQSFRFHKPQVEKALSSLTLP